MARLGPGTNPAGVRARIRALVSPTPVRIRSAAQTPYLREADGVLPPEWEKVFFGQFAARPEPSGALRIDPSWTASHIVSVRVPILGRVRCNRTLLPALRANRLILRSILAGLWATLCGCFTGFPSVRGRAWLPLQLGQQRTKRLLRPVCLSASGTLLR